MKEIKLYNRDGADLRLSTNDNTHWELVVDDNHKYILEYMRVGKKQTNNSIEFIDPSGGPMISVGQQIDLEHAISNITEATNKFIIETF